METNTTNNQPSEIQQLIKVNRAIYTKLCTISGWVTFMGIILIIALVLIIIGGFFSGLLSS